MTHAIMPAGLRPRMIEAGHAPPPFFHRGLARASFDSIGRAGFRAWRSQTFFKAAAIRRPMESDGATKAMIVGSAQSPSLMEHDPTRRLIRGLAELQGKEHCTGDTARSAYRGNTTPTPPSDGAATLGGGGPPSRRLRSAITPSTEAASRSDSDESWRAIASIAATCGFQRKCWWLVLLSDA